MMRPSYIFYGNPCTDKHYLYTEMAYRYKDNNKMIMKSLSGKEQNGIVMLQAFPGFRKVLLDMTSNKLHVIGTYIWCQYI